MAYLPITPSACIWLIDRRVSFTASWPCLYCGPTSRLSQALADRNKNDQTKREAGKFAASPVARGGADALVRSRHSPTRFSSRLRSLARPLGFESLLVFYFGPANVDLDLLRLGFRFLGQSHFQHALVVVRRNLLGVHGGGQGEGAGEAAVLALHTAVILFFLFLLDPALAVDGQGIVFQADIDVLLLNARDFNL